MKEEVSLAKGIEQKGLINVEIKEAIETKKTLYELTDKIREFSNIIISTLRNGNKIMICGNGGSAADAQHFAAELVVKFKHERKSMPCVALTTDTSALTAIINDFGGDFLYSKQVEGLGNSGDVLIGISTSGKAKNVRMALQEAKRKSLRTVALTSTGPLGGEFAALADLGIAIPSTTTSRIQECHMAILHIVMEIVDKELFLS